MKEQLKSDIIVDIAKFIDDASTLSMIKSVLEKNFYGYEITRQTTELSTTVLNTNEDMIKKFAIDRKIEGLSVKSIEQYVRTTRLFFDFIGNKSYLDVTGDDVKHWIAHMVSIGNSNTTVENNRKFLKSFFNYLYINDYMAKDVFKTVKTIKKEEKVKQFLTDADMTRMRDVCTNNKELAMIDFLYSTGLRVSEFANLRIDDVDFTSGEAQIYAPKTRKWRTVYIDSPALKHVQDYINNRSIVSPYLFASRNGKKMANGTIEKTLCRISEKANINKHCSVHIFRKSLATRLYVKDMDIAMIAKILGHSSIKTTEKYYLSISQADIKNCFKKITA